MFNTLRDGPITHGPLAIEALTGGPFSENCYIAQSETAALIIDPGHSARVLIDKVDTSQLQIVAVANTHAHIDHVAAVSEICELSNAPFWLHGDEEVVLQSIPLQAQMFGFPLCNPPKPDRLLVDNDILAIGEIKLQVLHTPGHSPGGCCFYQPEARVIFVGDTLFAGSIGRSDLPGGDHDTLIASIKARLLTLPDDVVCYSGHGPQTTIGHERERNPFLR